MVIYTYSYTAIIGTGSAARTIHSDYNIHYISYEMASDHLRRAILDLKFQAKLRDLEVRVLSSEVVSFESNCKFPD